MEDRSHEGWWGALTSIFNKETALLDAARRRTDAGYLLIVPSYPLSVLLLEFTASLLSPKSRASMRNADHGHLTVTVMLWT